MASHLGRRKFLATLGGAAAWPLAARAQQPEQMRRVGVLMGWPESDAVAQGQVAAFRASLQGLGWTEGRNIRFDHRWAALDAEAMHRFAKELIALKPDLILSQSTPATTALLQETRTIPIIFGVASDPIGSGCREPRPARRQCYRFHHYRGFSWGQVAGITQGDRAMDHAGRCHVQPGSGPICRNLHEPLQNRRSVLRRGGERGSCSKYNRDRIRR